MNTAHSYVEDQAQVEPNEEAQFALADDQLALIAGGQCTTNSI